MTTIAADHDLLESTGAMPSTRRVLTVHAGISLPVRFALLDAIEKALAAEGIERVWVDTSYRSELVVLAEFDED